MHQQTGIEPMKKYLEDKFTWFLDPTKNILKNLPPEQAFTFSMILSGMWSLSFCLYFGQILMIAPWILGHFAIIICIFTTWLVFKHAGAREHNHRTLSSKSDTATTPTPEMVGVRSYLASWIQQEKQLMKFSAENRNTSS